MSQRGSSSRSQGSVPTFSESPTRVSAPVSSARGILLLAGRQDDDDGARDGEQEE